jgi:hypothetical protein
LNFYAKTGKIQLSDIEKNPKIDSGVFSDLCSKKFKNKNKKTNILIGRGSLLLILLVAG